MVDTRDLKSLGHYGCTSSSLVSGTSLLLSCSAGGSFFLLFLYPLYVYGMILPQRGKKQRKTDILFCRCVEIDRPTLQNNCVWSSRTCAYVRAPSNSDVVFLLSQVSHAEKKVDKKQPEIQRNARRKTRFPIPFTPN